MNLLWLNMEDNEQLYIVENRKILKNNLAILSHWFAPETDPTKRKNGAEIYTFFVLSILIGYSKTFNQSEWLKQA